MRLTIRWLWYCNSNEIQRNALTPSDDTDDFNSTLLRQRRSIIAHSWWAEFRCVPSSAELMPRSTSTLQSGRRTVTKRGLRKKVRNAYQPWLAKLGRTHFKCLWRLLPMGHRRMLDASKRVEAGSKRIVPFRTCSRHASFSECFLEHVVYSWELLHSFYWKV